MGVEPCDDIVANLKKAGVPTVSAGTVALGPQSAADLRLMVCGHHHGWLALLNDKGEAFAFTALGDARQLMEIGEWCGRAVQHIIDCEKEHRHGKAD